MCLGRFRSSGNLGSLASNAPYDNAATLKSLNSLNSLLEAYSAQMRAKLIIVFVAFCMVVSDAYS